MQSPTSIATCTRSQARHVAAQTDGEGVENFWTGLKHDLLVSKAIAAKASASVTAAETEDDADKIPGLISDECVSSSLVASPWPQQHAPISSKLRCFLTGRVQGHRPRDLVSLAFR